MGGASKRLSRTSSPTVSASDMEMSVSWAARCSSASRSHAFHCGQDDAIVSARIDVCGVDPRLGLVDWIRSSADRVEAREMTGFTMTAAGAFWARQGDATKGGKKWPRLSSG